MQFKAQKGTTVAGVCPSRRDGMTGRQRLDLQKSFIEVRRLGFILLFLDAFKLRSDKPFLASV